MNDSEDESILISTGSENSIDKIEVYQIPIKQLMHEAIYNLLKDIKNSIKIIPIKDSLVLVLHYFTDKYKDGGLKLWKNFTDMFNWLPIAALIDDKIFCVHGGLSPDLENIEQLYDIIRPTDVPNSGLLCDILWSDPSTEVDDWGQKLHCGASEFAPQCVYSCTTVRLKLDCGAIFEGFHTL